MITFLASARILTSERLIYLQACLREDTQGRHLRGGLRRDEHRSGSKTSSGRARFPVGRAAAEVTTPRLPHAIVLVKQ